LIDLKNLLVLDIETVSGFQDYDQLNDRFKKQWDRKAAFLKNEDQLSSQALYYEKAAIYAEFGKIVCIAVGIFTRGSGDQMALRVKAFAGHDEKLVLEGFKELIEVKLDKENLVLCAHNGKEFDFPYLCRRYLVNEIEIPSILQIAGKKPWEVPHVDTMEMWKFGDRKSYTSLDLLASLFNIESSKGEMDGSVVNSVYYEEQDLKKIEEYCKQDVVVTANLYLKLNRMPALDPGNIHII
jgi:predicted PolB exonuclease-like 3'-5' exonuclease